MYTYRICRTVFISVSLSVGLCSRRITKTLHIFVKGLNFPTKNIQLDGMNRIKQFLLQMYAVKLIALRNPTLTTFNAMWKFVTVNSSVGM